MELQAALEEAECALEAEENKVESVKKKSMKRPQYVKILYFRDYFVIYFLYFRK